MNYSDLQSSIEKIYANISADAKYSIKESDQRFVQEALKLLDEGKIRVSEPTTNGWVTHAWVKQAILLYFRIQPMAEMSAGPQSWNDKIPLKNWNPSLGVRVVPPATVRFGAFVAKGAILMPSYVNIGAYVDQGSMVDTWATVGSCAQIGKNVHLSGGVGIGGVLEPPQADPVIIEDNCFIGSRAIVVEGVRIEQGAVLGAGVVLTKSTPIVNTKTGEVTKGRVPAHSVVIPGTMPKTFPGGSFQVPCALILGLRSAITDSKTSLNQALRDFEVSV